MRDRLLLFAAMAALITFSTCARKDIRRDMAGLDRAFIPAFSFAGDKQPAETKAAMSRLTGEWNRFRDRYRTYRPKDEQWATDFDRFSNLIVEANQVVNTGGDLVVAQARLRVFRGLLRELRRRDSIDYYLDNVLDFSGPLEGMMLAVRNQTPEKLPDAAVDAVRNVLPTVRNYWNKVKEARFDAGLFGFDAKKTAELQDCIRAVSAGLDQLEQSLAQSDKSRIITAGVQLESSATRLYRLFGDFPKSR